MNKRALFFLIVIIFSIVIQTSVLPVYIDGLFKPDLLLILMVFISLRYQNVPGGALIAWLLGLLKDLFSGLYTGLNAFAFLAIYLVIKHIADRLYTESPLLFVITITAASLAAAGLNLLLLLVFDQSHGIFYSMYPGIIPHLLVNAFAASLFGLFPDAGFIQDKKG